MLYNISYYYYLYQREPFTFLGYHNMSLCPKYGQDRRGMYLTYLLCDHGQVMLLLCILVFLAMKWDC